MAPEIQGDLFADGGRPGPPLVLNGCETSQQGHTVKEWKLTKDNYSQNQLRTQSANFVCVKEK